LARRGDEKEISFVEMGKNAKTRKKKVVWELKI